MVTRQLPQDSSSHPCLFQVGDETPYTGEIAAYETLQAWAADKCVPLVREITFENAEELTEEGLPFLILFHHPDDKEVRGG